MLKTQFLLHTMKLIPPGQPPLQQVKVNFTIFALPAKRILVLAKLFLSKVPEIHLIRIRILIQVTKIRKMNQIGVYK